MSRKAPRATSPQSNVFSSLFVSLCKAVSMDIPGLYAYWSWCNGLLTRTPSRICLSSNFSNVFSMNDMRLIGLGDFAWVVERPGFGMNTTLICLHVLGMYPMARLALITLTRGPARTSSPCWSIMGMIPSGPGDLCGSNELIAHFIFFIVYYVAGYLPVFFC